jgi:periplasmic divalent cation tolerance protein
VHRRARWFVVGVSLLVLVLFISAATSPARKRFVQSNSSICPITMAGMRVILCTTPAGPTSSLVAKALINAGAACVNILPQIRSIYKWKDEIHDDVESLLVIKANSDIVSELEKAMKGVHPYELPEWVVLTPDVALSSQKYLSWVMGGGG